MFDSQFVAGMANSILAKHYDDPCVTPPFHYDLWDLCCSDYKYVAIAAPRGHAKSTAITYNWLIAGLMYRKFRYVTILSDTEGQSAEFIEELRTAFRDNDELRQTWGILRFERDSNIDIIVSMADGWKFRVHGKGAEQKVRGKKWMGQRPDLFLIDDLENEELTDSDMRREKLRRWMYGSVLPAGNDRCLYRMVGTVLHFDSLLESFMPGPKKFTQKGDLFVANYPDRLDQWASIKFRAHTDDFEKILWPQKFSKERLTGIRQAYTEDGQPETYAQEYLNEPIAEDNAFFAKGDFLPFDPDKYDGTLKWYAAADLAISKQDRSKFTVISVSGLDLNGKLQVRDIRRGRWDSKEIIDEMFSVQQRYEPEVFWVESENIQKALGPIIEDEMLRRGVFINIETVTPSKDKETRARSLQARMRAGGMLFDKKADWYFDLETEMRRFPKGPYNDQVDSLGLIPFGINKMVAPQTQQEVEQEEYEDMFIPAGRDMMTGY